jgi:hypothetical protein
MLSGFYTYANFPEHLIDCGNKADVATPFRHLEKQHPPGSMLTEGMQHLTDTASLSVYISLSMKPRHDLTRVIAH